MALDPERGNLNGSNASRLRTTEVVPLYMKEKVRKLSFVDSIKKFYLNKKIYVLLFIFFISNFLIFKIYSDNLTLFALKEKLFFVSEAWETYPPSLLSTKLDCSLIGNISSTCGLDALLLILLFIYTEIITLWVIISNRKIILKRLLIIFLFFQQVFPLTSFIIYGYTPDKVFSDLAAQANKDITNTVELLNNSSRRQEIGIIDSFTKITERLETNNTTPKFVETQTEEEAILQAQGITQSSLNTFYKAIVIPYQTYASSSAQLKQKLQFDALLFPSNVLVIKSFNKDLIEQITPVLSQVILKSEYGKHIGSKENKYQYKVLNEEEYVIVQKEAEKEFKEKLEKYIKEVEVYLANLDYTIKDNERYISDLKTRQETYLRMWEKWFSLCKNILGEGDSQCQEEIKERDKNVQVLENKRKEAEGFIQSARTKKPIWFTILQRAKESYENWLKHPITPELQDGVFRPPNSIYLKYHLKDKYPFSIYLATSLHELLHYYSYHPKNDLGTFLNEGFTDYFSMKTIIGYTMNQGDYVHYPYGVIATDQILKSIPEEELLKIYFSQDSLALEKNIDTNFPKGTYKQLIQLGDSLSYTDFKDTATRENLINNILSLIPAKEASDSADRIKPPKVSKLHDSFAKNSQIISYQLFEDVTGDGKTETIYVTIDNGCISCHQKYIYVTQEDKTLIELTGDDSQVNALPSGKGFTVKQPVRKDEEPLCCPSEYKTDTYIWNGSSFIKQKN